jgi:hypothetical protein
MRLGVGAAALLALGGGAVALLEPGLHAGRLTARGRLVFGNVARAFLEGVLPSGAEPLRAFLDRVDGLVGALPVHARDELSQLLALLGTSPGRRSLAGLEAHWDHASLAQLQDALQSMRTSSLALRQQAYLALHDITNAAYFSDASTWHFLGYPGPVPV